METRFKQRQNPTRLIGIAFIAKRIRVDNRKLGLLGVFVYIINKQNGN
jgi:hypothetical protein